MIYCVVTIPSTLNQDCFIVNTALPFSAFSTYRNDVIGFIVPTMENFYMIEDLKKNLPTWQNLVKALESR